MSPADPAGPEAPPRKRRLWSLRSLVEDVSGKPISHFQEPPPANGRATVRAHASGPAVAVRSTEEEIPRPERLYPPLVGALGREYHGPQGEHHRETLERHRAPVDEPAAGMPGRSPGPANRPERIYLHYLLLHIDRLSDSSLRYLRHSVNEEIAHRVHPSPAPPKAEAVSEELAVPGP